MATVLEVITAALVTVKALAVGETPGADMTTDALDKFNDVLEVLSIQNLAVFASVDAVVPLVAGQATYLVGPGGVGQRPLGMNAIDSVRVNFGDVDYPVDLVPQDEYDSLAVKQITGVPEWAAYDNGYPNATLQLFPVPYQTGVLTLSQRKQFMAASALTDTFDMPPGYRRMIRLMLAWELRTDYPGMSPQEIADLKADVAGSIGTVKRANIESATLAHESADLDASGGGGVDWRTGD